MRVTRAVLVAFAALTLLSCGSWNPQSAPPASRSVPVEVTPVPLDPRDASVPGIGPFVYAGGIEIRSADSPGVHELSDLRIVPGDRLVAVSDRGYTFEARLLFDETARLAGLSDATLAPLVNERGEPLAGTDGDAEGLDILPNEDRLVSFEQNHRIWLYPADGGPPRPVPSPDAQLPGNGGMEALSLYPAAGPGFYLAGSEGGTVWLCNLALACADTAFGTFVPRGFGLTALAASKAVGGLVMLARAYDPRLDTTRVSVKLIRATAAGDGSVLDEMTLAAPLTVDNFEGVAVVPRPSGGIRLYLLSDDNGSTAQRTYLLAFDWQPR